MHISIGGKSSVAAVCTSRASRSPAFAIGIFAVSGIDDRSMVPLRNSSVSPPLGRVVLNAQAAGPNFARLDGQMCGGRWPYRMIDSGCASRNSFVESRPEYCKQREGYKLSWWMPRSVRSHLVHELSATRMLRSELREVVYFIATNDPAVIRRAMFAHLHSAEF